MGRRVLGDQRPADKAGRTEWELLSGSKEVLQGDEGLRQGVRPLLRVRRGPFSLFFLSVRDRSSSFVAGLPQA